MMWYPDGLGAWLLFVEFREPLGIPWVDLSGSLQNSKFDWVVIVVNLRGLISSFTDSKMFDIRTPV